MKADIFSPLHKPHCGEVCFSCNMREICLPVGLSRQELAYIERRLVATRRKVAAGTTLFHMGDRFESLYAVWTGFFKTCLTSPDGREQVTGFHMGGDILGLEGIDQQRHEVDAVALEDSQVCVIPYSELEVLEREVDALQKQFHRVMSRELVRARGTMLVLGGMFAEERLAAFLLNLLHRLQARGFSSTTLTLRMSREEIGSYLGLSLETISRSFSKLQAQGLIHVRNRELRVTDPLGLQHVIDGVDA